MAKYLIIFIILVVSIPVFAVPPFSLEISGGANLGGISQAGYTGNNYNNGYNFAVQPFIALSNKIWLGNQISYSRFFPSSKISMIEYASLIKFAPSIRYITSPAPNPKLFYQLGIGYYWLHERWEDMDYRYVPTSSKDEITIKDLGINIGLGFLINSRFVICPSCDIVFHEKKSTKYFKIDLGVIL